MDLYRIVTLLGFLTACSALNSWEIPEGNLLDYVDPDLTADWLRFKKEYNRTYDDSYEELKRRIIWEDARRFVEEHNRKYELGEYTYTVGENDFADLADDEVRKYYLSSLIVPENFGELDQTSNENIEGYLNAPSSRDWRKSGKVTRVRNQGQCGSCWAFSALGAMESAYMIKHGSGRQVDFSEQQLVDCAYGRSWGNFACRGGWMANAYKYIKWFGGINSENCYRYVGRQQRCMAKKSCIAARLVEYKKVRQTESELQRVVGNIGPVAIAANVNSPGFWRFRSGVFNDPGCRSIPNHAMVAVGYGTAGGHGQYWLIKNSWGEGWGDRGYINMARNRNNQCGIASYAVYPVVS